MRPHGCGTFADRAAGTDDDVRKGSAGETVRIVVQAFAFLARALWMTVLADLCFRLEWQDCSTLTARPSATGRK